MCWQHKRPSQCRWQHLLSPLWCSPRHLFVTVASIALTHVCGRAAGSVAGCRLTSLSLRFQDQPVDLVPAFDPDTFAYVATLDSGMDAFSVDARSGDGCEPDQLPIQAVPLERGGLEQLSVNAKDLFTGAKQAYGIKVTRLLGSETDVQLIRVQGGELTPAFHPKNRLYTAKLALGLDFVSISYVLRDAGQKVRCDAEAQKLFEQRGSVVSDELQAKGRLLGKSGEVQYIERRQQFPIDAGYSRRVTMTIQSADELLADIGTYTLEIRREGCTLGTPLYDPISKACVVNCPSEFYRHLLAYRCAKCNTNCAVCTSLLQCQLCYEDTIDDSYMLQPDGSCMRAPRELQRKYWWWCVGLCMLVALLGCLGFGLLCQCLCNSCQRRRTLPAYDSETEADSEFDFPHRASRQTRGW